MACVPLAPDGPSPHLTAEPGISIPFYNNLAGTHEIPAVHPYVSLNNDAPCIHVFPDPFDIPGLSGKDDLDLVRGDGRSLRGDIKDLFQSPFLVPFVDTDIIFPEKILRNDGLSLNRNEWFLPRFCPENDSHNDASVGIQIPRGR